MVEEERCLPSQNKAYSKAKCGVHWKEDHIPLSVLQCRPILNLSYVFALATKLYDFDINTKLQWLYANWSRSIYLLSCLEDLPSADEPILTGNMRYVWSRVHSRTIAAVHSVTVHKLLLYLANIGVFVFALVRELRGGEGNWHSNCRSVNWHECLVSTPEDRKTLVCWKKMCLVTYGSSEVFRWASWGGDCIFCIFQLKTLIIKICWQKFRTFFYKKNKCLKKSQNLVFYSKKWGKIQNLKKTAFFKSSYWKIWDIVINFKTFLILKELYN